MEQLQKLDLSNCKTNKEVTNKICERVISTSLNDIISYLSTDFVYQEETIKDLYVALSTGKNAILYGPGGFSKSVLVKAFCELLGIPTIVKLGNTESNVEDLLGIPNMQKLMKDSILETSFENSIFAKPGILLLEEFTDVRPVVAAALKDVLTEKGLREKDSFKESLISSIIITGNTDPSLMENNDNNSDSIKAFYKERFPISRKVIWKDFSENAYLKYFNTIFKEDYTKNFKKFLLLSKICANSSEIISPRIARDAGDIIIKLGVDFLSSMKVLNLSDINKYILESEEAALILSEKELILQMSKIIIYYKSLLINSSASDYLHVAHCSKKFLTILPLNSSIENLDALCKIRTELNEIINEVEEKSPDLFNYRQDLIDLQNLKKFEH